MTDLRLPFDEEPATTESRIDARDRAGRERAVDPKFNVALQASAGTGKTKVLVDRYVNLVRAGVDPSEILALTFTRKAATEMRDRIIATLRSAAARGEIAPARWRELRDRTGDVEISTIDAFCLSLLREFPLEADLSPGFQVADDTEVPRLVDESLDRALRTCRSVAREDDQVALVFAQLGDRRARAGLASLLNRRIVAPAALSRYLATGPRDLTVAGAARQGAAALVDVFHSMRGGLDRFLETGPLHPSFGLLLRQVRRLDEGVAAAVDVDPALVQAAFGRTREHFLTQNGEPRKRLPQKYKKTTFASAPDWRAHQDLLVSHAPAIVEAYARYRRDLNVLVARGVWRMFAIAETEYRRTLDSRAVLDFPDLLLRALELLRQMEEFAQSRFRLEARYHHVLVDEFQDTSRAQWELVSLLIRAWGEGAGVAHAGALPPSIFIVGDRKQSIYAFRDAEVALFQEASRYLGTLRPGGDVRHSISRSFRSVAPLLAFVNDLCDALDKAPERRDAFLYEEADRFPVDVPGDGDLADALALVVGNSPEECARVTAGEIDRLIAAGVLVRDPETGVRRPVRPGDVAILFRTRESHQDYEKALEQRGISAYVYKGLGFFDADEIKDVLAVLWYLADPTSDLRTAAWLRSRFVRMSDEGLRRLGPRLARALDAPAPPEVELDAADTDALWLARRASARWRARVDRMPPAELLDLVLRESAYRAELRGPRLAQARENLKKIRATIRRIQNRGYATLDRIATHLDRLALGDEANAVIDATSAVSLMTVHASKGLEFPVVFVVNLARGSGKGREPIRVVVPGTGQEVSVTVGDFESGTDEDEAAKDREETKRLLYVALTRARDRLYLGSVVKDGRLQPGRGSLGEVLPSSVQALFGEAAVGAEVVSWSVSSRTHPMRVCALADERLQETGSRSTVRHQAVGSDFDVLDDDAVPRAPVVAPAESGGDEDVVMWSGGRGSDRVVGALVHRLLQRGGLDEVSESHLRQVAMSSLGGEYGEDVGDLAARVEEAVAAYKALSVRPDLRELYASGDPFHEVPFTMVADGRIVRGTIDCLVRTAADRVTVLEFKTGRRRDEHQAQIATYRLAVQALFPGATVDARLVYAGDAIAP